MRWLVLLALPFANPCSKVAAGSADAAPSASSIAVVSASSAPPPAPPPTASGPSEAEKQTLAKGKKTLSSIESFVARNALSDPAQPGEDAKMACAAFDDQKPALQKLADPEAQTVVEKGTKLCAFDVALLAANDWLNQLSKPRSQASTLLFCKSAQREISQARSAQPNDPRVRRLQARQISLCANEK